jgi:hypothetical protein
MPSAGIGEEVRVRMLTAEKAPEEPAVPRQSRSRRVTGRAYMVDVEPGRWRLRLKMPDGRDLTLDATEELAEILKRAVDQLVEIESIEELEGDSISSRTAVDLQVLPSSGPGSAKPPKSVEELAREQGMPATRPDYVALASNVWTSDDELAEFAEYLHQIRRSGVA